MRATTAFWITALAAGLATSGAGVTAARAAGLPAARAAAAPVASMPEVQVLDSGEATWYGPRHTGLRTFNGERFDPRQMTAAHPSLPMGTMVRVTDTATGRSVIVRVNDREPPHGVRCIDLSEGAATALGIHGRGVADVTITSVLPHDMAGEAPVEVAEAPDDAVATDAAPIHRRAITARHGRQHRRHAGR